jgi:hypothetical protein
MKRQHRSARRLVENEVFFRQRNEQAVDGLADLKDIAKEDGQTEWLPDTDAPIEFYCECADEKCQKRVKLAPSTYAKLHQNKSQFTISPGHNVPAVERIMKSTKNYTVVEKYETPPGRVTTTNSTELHHE